MLILFSAIFFILSKKLRLLTTGGAIAAIIIGCSTAILAGFFYLLPLVVFFVSGSLLHFLLPTPTSVSDEKQGKPRDAIQVLSNGGIYTLLAIFFSYSSDDLYVKAMCVSMCIALSDTWSSDVGIAFGGNTYNIIGFKPVSPGLSGGISFNGTVAGLTGAFFMAIAAHYLLGLTLSLTEISGIAVWGFSGMLLDSVVGSLFQIKYRHPESSTFADIAFSDADDKRGINWMTNDVVNLISNALVTSVFLFVKIY